MEFPLIPSTPPPRLDRLVALIETLRGEGGCPWDRKQTPESVARYIIEESYELVDAIMTGEAAAICEEAGDALFQLLFVVQLYAESQRFDLADVIDANLEKMIRRHPHVFGDETAETPEKVKANWEKIKREEKAGKARQSLLDDIPQGMPALLRAAMISQRAAATGFDWSDLKGVMEKTMEEWQEFACEVDRPQASMNMDDVAEEFGDILFTMVNVARFARIHPETALIRSIQKFERRFRCMEAAAGEKGKEISQLSYEEMHRLWEQAKRQSG